MRVVISIFKTLCYLLLLNHLILVVYAVYFKISFGYVFNYNDKGIVSIAVKYFKDLTVIENMLWILSTAWIILFLIMVGARQFSFKRAYGLAGIIGFSFSIVYVFLDPFGLIEYFVD